jgi:hypothetical protein
MIISTSNSKEAQQAALQGVARDDDSTYAATFLADLDELEAATSTHQDVARVRRLLRE